MKRLLKLTGDRTFEDEKLPSWWAIPLVTYICLIIALSLIPFNQLPEDRHFSADPEEFIGFKAEYYLNELTKIGPRVVGSKANEVTTVSFLLNETAKIANESYGYYHIETDVQVVSGKYRAYGRINHYNSVQNVIVKLRSTHSNNSNAILINSHFDSVLTSPGAGDDGSMVAVMLGVLNSLTKSNSIVKHPIIFLFNGAEETGLEASHGFITQHKWAKDIKAYINVDTLGIGGKEMLFQSGPENTWLLDYYGKAAKYPFGSVLAEEIFRSGSMPSDSDATIFRNYGNLPGLELIYVKNGYAYHTDMDKYSNIDDGSLQNAGINVLALIRALANAEELKENHSAKPTGRGVYFDVLGLFFVNYSETTAIVLNCLISIISLIVITLCVWINNKSSGLTTDTAFKQFGLAFLLQLGSITVATCSVLLIGYFIEIIHYSKSWYSQHWFVFGLYYCPTLFILGMIPAVFLSSRFLSRYSLKFNLMLVLYSQCVILVAIIIILTAVSIRSTFIITLVVLFYLVAMLLNLIPAISSNAYLWVLPVIFGQSIPLAFNTYITQIVFTIFIPITSRLRSEADFQIAFIAVISSILLFGFIIPLFSVFRHGKTILMGFLAIFILSFLLIFTAIAFPYTEVATQRHTVFYTVRAKHDIKGSITVNDSIFAALEYDHHSRETGISELNGLNYFTWEKDNPDLIYYKNNYGMMKAPNLHLPDAAKLRLSAKEEIVSDPGTYKFSFEITGGAQSFRLNVRPLQKNQMIDWSFNLPEDVRPLEAQKEYSARIQFGKETWPYSFWIILKIADTSLASLAIEMHAQYLDEGNEWVKGFQEFLNTFPRWAARTGIISSYDSYDF